MKFLPKVMYYWETKQPEKNIKLAEMQLKLYPENFVVYEVLRELYVMKREFGKLKKRTITNAQFVTEIEDQESGNKISGFFVFLEYASEYENIKKLIETILLQQDDKTKWKILDWRYHFESPSSEEENTPIEKDDQDD